MVSIQQRIKIIHHHLTLCRHQHSPYSVIYIKPYRPTKRIVHLLIVDGRTGRKRNKLNETQALLRV